MSPYYSQELRIENAKLKAALRQMIDFYDEHQLKMAAIARQLEGHKVMTAKLLPKLDLRMARIVEINNAAESILEPPKPKAKQRARRRVKELQ